MMFHKTKAAILNESHKPLLIEEIQLPIKLDAGQVFVEIFYTSICGAQINEIDAVKGVDKFLPHLLGHEACAEVLEIGSGVRHVKPKDIVVLHWRPSLGIEAEPYKYLRENNSIVNAGWVTTFQQYAVISENRMTVIPPWFDKKIAPLLGCAVTTAYGIVNYESQIRTGESVLIIGVGGVGLQIAQFAKLAGADTICAMDIDREKLNSAKKYANMTYLY